MESKNTFILNLLNNIDFLRPQPGPSAKEHTEYLGRLFADNNLDFLALLEF